MAATGADILKRCFDIVAGALALLVLTPMLTVIALVVRRTSPGPVFYRGRRTGLGGRPFRIYKFRSMVVDAEQTGGLSTAKNDPRVTPIGRFLRRHKLDELPQLINVLKGDMSIVGPRPEMPEYTRLYSGEELLILSVRPGITDYASLQFVRLDEALGAVKADEVYETEVRPVKNRLRIRYVRTRSFWTDLSILFQTVSRLAGLPFWNMRN